MTKLETFKKINDWSYKRFSEIEADYQNDETKLREFSYKIVDTVASKLKDVTNFIIGEMYKPDNNYKLDEFWLTNLSWLVIYDFDYITGLSNDALNSKDKNEGSDNINLIIFEMLKYEKSRIELRNFSEWIISQKNCD